MAASRLRILQALDDRPHRYRRIRRVTQALTLLVLYGAPALGLVRFDLWAGHHRWLGRPAGAFQGAFGVVLGILVFYGITFLINAVFGRLFCGFGCPIGEASRLADAVDAAKPAHARRLARLRALTFDAALAGAIATWFVDPRVLLEGTLQAVTFTVVGFVALTALVYLHGAFWRWNFCRKACPIGLYYTFVQPLQAYGVVFDAASEACIDCGLCDAVCPVLLHPRRLGETVSDIGGLALDGFPAQNHCLTCGDCVRACQLVMAPRAADPPLRYGWRLRTRRGVRTHEVVPAQGENAPFVEAS